MDYIPKSAFEKKGGEGFRSSKFKVQKLKSNLRERRET
jgi:hypothetical protein